MKSLILTLSMAVLAAAFTPLSADARRIGGGGSAGMQRSLPARSAPSALPATPAAPAAKPAQAAPATPATAAVPPAVAPRRSWLGPIAGLAAGLGIAALMSHFGLGAAMGNIVTLLLVAFVAVVAIRFLMRRFGAGQTLASPNGANFNRMDDGRNTIDAAPGGVAPAQPATLATASALPADFDAPAFERIAKLIFIRMQAANDSADLNDLRTFTTPEMFAAIKLDLQERGASAQQTDVVRVDAEALDVASEAQRQIVSVRFHGLIREQKDGVAEPFDEVWHLVRPLDGSREWAIAGIQQSAAA
ncbi:MAG TPA: Tim44-like domain-containing protein [Burkholderiaceae bacterium]|jgi:predicted lipid-binding transport protein (Tim44 family)